MTYEGWTYLIDFLILFGSCLVFSFALRPFDRIVGKLGLRPRTILIMQIAVTIFAIACGKYYLRVRYNRMIASVVRDSSRSMDSDYNNPRPDTIPFIPGQ